MDMAQDAAADEIPDLGKSPTQAEPLIVSEESPHRSELNEMVLTLTERSAELRTELLAPLRGALADTVRAMNCYYSNLIEGHYTHPIDIERALNEDYSADPEKRDLQREARAHIEVQAWIDGGGLIEHPLAIGSLREIHRRFCEQLPASLLTTIDPETKEERLIIPGEFRTRFVQVGRHIAPSPGAVPRFLDHLRHGYERPGRLARIIGIGCAHHRLAWVHPFMDLNGRVMRMVSHAMSRDLLASEGLWSISRGLARRVDDYKRLLMAADEPRHGDRDGRGNLSEAALADFARFFLEVSIDQVNYMAQLMQPSTLRDRIMVWAREEIEGGRLPAKSDTVLRVALSQGEIRRAEVAGYLGVKDRMARNVTSALLEKGTLVSNGPKAPLRIAFPAHLAPRWMPGLFPEALKQG